MLNKTRLPTGMLDFITSTCLYLPGFSNNFNDGFEDLHTAKTANLGKVRTDTESPRHA